MIVIVAVSIQSCVHDPLSTTSNEETFHQDLWNRYFFFSEASASWRNVSIYHMHIMMFITGTYLHPYTSVLPVHKGLIEGSRPYMQIVISIQTKPTTKQWYSLIYYILYLSISSCVTSEARSIAMPSETCNAALYTKKTCCLCIIWLSATNILLWRLPRFNLIMH